MRKNFKNPKTGEEFSIGVHKSKGDGKYYDQYDKVLVDPKDGTPLEFIPREGPIGAPMILGSEKDRNKKTQEHFKKRANKHAQSEEGKALKKKAIDREMRNMGLKRKE